MSLHVLPSRRPCLAKWIRPLPFWARCFSPSQVEYHFILSQALSVALESESPMTSRTTACLKRGWICRRTSITVLAKHLALILHDGGFSECVLVDGNCLKLIQKRDCVPSLYARAIEP